MKKIYKKASIMVVSLCLATSLLSVNGLAMGKNELSKSSVKQVAEITQSNIIITPCSDKIGWRYKSIDGKIYRRQYNYSKGKWIGKWQLCK